MALMTDQQLLMDSLRDSSSEALSSILSRHVSYWDPRPVELFCKYTEPSLLQLSRSDGLHFEDLLLSWPLRLKQELYAATESKVNFGVAS